METGIMITILAAGSRGDVQPYLALAIKLKRLGKEVRIAVTRNHESFVRGYGIDFYPVGADIESLNVDKNMIKQAQQADNPFKMLLSFQKMKKYGIHMVHDYYSACEGSDLIVYHPGAAIGFFAAEILGTPAVLAAPFPLNKTKKQPSVILYGRVKSSPPINRLSYALLQKMLWTASGAALKPFWQERFGRLPECFGAPYERHTDIRHPALVSCSNFVFQRPEDWNEHIHQHGYWFLEEPEEYHPPSELADFLDRGEPPVYAGFGSMFDPDETEKISGLIIAGLARAGKRGILSGMGKPSDLPETILAVENIPHSWLFQRVLAVCHHGGAGTTATGFKAGVPSVILPFALDQHAWARRAYDLGVGSKPVPVRRLTPEMFTAALQEALQDRTAANAKALARQIATEDGAGESARVIAACLEHSNPGKH
jgi:sterol 3beta-glucosyltransferase